jgi:hypothetical protein
MSYYNYKRVRDVIPEEFVERYKAKCLAEGYEYEGTCNYNGDMWSMTAEYIEELHAQLKATQAPNPKEGQS